jgi:hypothetical protein
MSKLQIPVRQIRCERVSEPLSQVFAHSNLRESRNRTWEPVEDQSPRLHQYFIFEALASPRASLLLIPISAIATLSPPDWPENCRQSMDASNHEAGTMLLNVPIPGSPKVYCRESVYQVLLFLCLKGLGS